MLSLEQLGFRVHKMRGRDESELFLLVGASQSVLEYHADALKIKCPLKPPPLVLKRAKALGARPPAIRMPFSTRNREAFRSAKEGAFEFRSRLKAEIVQQAIEAPEFLGGAGINLEAAASSGDIRQFFILHIHSLQYLRDHWAQLQRAFGRGRLSELPYDDRSGWINPTEQPIEKLREYFGEKIALCVPVALPDGFSGSTVFGCPEVTCRVVHVMSSDQVLRVRWVLRQVAVLPSDSGHLRPGFTVRIWYGRQLGECRLQGLLLWCSQITKA